MQTMTQHWKNRIDDLLARAVDVRSADVAPAMSALTVARCMSGVVHLVAERYGVSAMQEACAQLARAERPWQKGLGDLPRRHDGRVSEPVKLLGVVAAGILPIAGERAVRAALAFWAVTEDPADWRQISGR